jgi:prepilin-type N-terminal cleavage/methylation domain-containing protein
MKNSFFLKKNPFSYIELMVALVLIGILASIVNLQVGKSFSLYRFKSNIERVYNYFSFSKEIAQANQSDFFLSFIQKEKGISCLLGTDEKQGVFNGEKRKSFFLKDLYFLFDGEKKEKIEILFSSTGIISPIGTFRFSDLKNRESKDISLLQFSQKKQKYKGSHPLLVQK